MEPRKAQPLQTVWGWKIAAYLFTAGMGAGAYALGAAAVIFSVPALRGLVALAMWLGLALVVGSVTFLVCDLGRPREFLRVLLRVRRSWLSRGSWILIAFTCVAAATLVSGQPVSLTAFSLAFAVAVAYYTGLLLGTILARPLWNNPVLPILFLISALSTGTALVVAGGLAMAMGGGIWPGQVLQAAAWLRPAHTALMATELLILYSYLSIASGRSPTAVRLLVSGPLSVPFWGGVVVLGIAVPMVLEVAGAAAGASPSGYLLPADLAVLIGGLLLRRLILLAGTRSAVQLGKPFVIRPEV